jgi:hypothetical protein
VAAGSALAAVALTGRTSSASDATRMLIVGDSMIAGGLGLFLERDFRKHPDFLPQRRGKSSSGLARPDFFNWFKEAERLAREFQPSASIVMFGGNDVQGLYMGKGEWIRWHEPGWRDEYARRVSAFCDVIAPSKERIFWIGMPVMRPEKFHKRVQRVNTIFRAEMAIRPGATFIDTWTALADEDGEYADRIAVDPSAADKTVRVRAGDGIHLSRAGAEFLADFVRRSVLQAFEAAS